MTQQAATNEKTGTPIIVITTISPRHAHLHNCSDGTNCNTSVEYKLLDFNGRKLYFCYQHMKVWKAARLREGFVIRGNASNEIPHML
jgi:hypothetical protein